MNTMATSNKPKFVAAALILVVLSIAASAGCSSPDNPSPSPAATLEPLSAQQVDEFIAASIATCAAVETVGFELQVSMTTEQTGQNLNNTVTVGNGSGMADITNRQMQSTVSLIQERERQEDRKSFLKNIYVVGPMVYYERETIS